MLPAEKFTRIFTRISPEFTRIFREFHPNFTRIHPNFQMRPSTPNVNKFGPKTRKRKHFGCLARIFIRIFTRNFARIGPNWPEFPPDFSPELTRIFREFRPILTRIDPNLMGILPDFNPNFNRFLKF